MTLEVWHIAVGLLMMLGGGLGAYVAIKEKIAEHGRDILSTDRRVTDHITSTHSHT